MAGKRHYRRRRRRPQGRSVGDACRPARRLPHVVKGGETVAAFRQNLQRGGGIGLVAVHRQQGEGEHHQRDVPVPAVPAPRLVAVQSQFAPRRLEGVLNRPPPALDANQCVHRSAVPASDCAIKVDSIIPLNDHNPSEH